MIDAFIKAREKGSSDINWIIRIIQMINVIIFVDG